MEDIIRHCILCVKEESIPYIVFLRFAHGEHGNLLTVTEKMHESHDKRRRKFFLGQNN